MSKFPVRGLAVLTVVALTSFSQAQEVPGSTVALRESPAWSLKDGVVSLTGEPSRDNFLSTRQALADSVTSLEYRSSKGAHAALYVQGRYAVALDGTGDWQRVAIRFRAPRMDPGFRKIANALMLEVRIGSEVRQNVVFPGASEGARW